MTHFGSSLHLEHPLEGLRSATVGQGISHWAHKGSWGSTDRVSRARLVAVPLMSSARYARSLELMLVTSLPPPSCHIHVRCYISRPTPTLAARAQNVVGVQRLIDRDQRRNNARHKPDTTATLWSTYLIISARDTGSVSKTGNDGARACGPLSKLALLVIHVTRNVVKRECMMMRVSWDPCTPPKGCHSRCGWQGCQRGGSRAPCDTPHAWSHPSPVAPDGWWD